MKIKNIIKITLTLILLVIMLVSYETKVEANSASQDIIQLASSSSSTGTINPEDFKPSDLTASDTATAFHSAGIIVSAIINVGLVISITMFMVLGIKYMMGSVEEKAEYKKTLIPMIVGTLLIFVSGKIVSIIWNIMSQVNV